MPPRHTGVPIAARHPSHGAEEPRESCHRQTAGRRRDVRAGHRPSLRHRHAVASSGRSAACPAAPAAPDRRRSPAHWRLLAPPVAVPTDRSRPRAVRADADDRRARQCVAAWATCDRRTIVRDSTGRC